MSAGGEPLADNERAFQLDVLRLQMTQGRRLALHSAYFTVGASFEIFSLTLVLTAVLLEKDIPLPWWVLIAMYLLAGIGFIGYAILGFGRTKRLEELEMRSIQEKYG